MKKIIFQLGLTLALCSQIFAAPTASDIMRKHAKASAEELEAYLKENPNAADKSKAHQGLLSAYTVTGDTQKKVAIFQDKFNALGSGPDVSTRSLYSITNSLFSLMVKTGMQKEASAIIEQAIKKSIGNKQEDALIDGFKIKLASLNPSSVGDPFPMKFTSLQGEEIDLEAMKGKIVLVDFWATWCGPCIAELPHLQKAYEKYHSQGFEIIGVSLDQKNDKEKLVSFIEKRKITWPHYFEEKQVGNRFATQYGISSIPATFLIGKDGKIIATNLRGNKLEELLSEHIPK